MMPPKITIIALSLALSCSITRQQVIESDKSERFDPQKHVRVDCGRPLFEKQSDPGMFAAYWNKRTSWQTGQTINVYFMNGTESEKGIVEHYAREWEKYANLKFDFKKGKKTTKEEAIVIVFKEIASGAAAYSILGGGTTLGNSESMAYPPKSRLRATIQHEFGHALGFHHEQDNPAGAKYWKRGKAEKYFLRQGYSKKFIKRYFAPSDKDRNWGEIDRYSVVSHHVPGDYLKDGYPWGLGTTISRRDAEGMAKLYPGRKPATEEQLITTQLYYNNQKKYLSLSSTGGRSTLFINGTAVHEQNSEKREVDEKIDITKFLVQKIDGRYDHIRLKFEKTSDEFYYAWWLDEGKRHLDSESCWIPKDCITKSGKTRDLTMNLVPFENRNRKSPDEKEDPVIVNDDSLTKELITAVFDDKTEQVLRLLKRGADPNGGGSSWTPLMYAAFHGNQLVVENLLRYGADKDKTGTGFTALAIARMRKKHKIVRILETFGIAPHRKAPYVKTRGLNLGGELKPPEP